MFLLLLFFFNDTATTEIYTLSLHDALPISDEHELFASVVALDVALCGNQQVQPHRRAGRPAPAVDDTVEADRSCAIQCSDRKSTRLNSSHTVISYAVFCLKKKKKNIC